MLLQLVILFAHMRRNFSTLMLQRNTSMEELGKTVLVYLWDNYIQYYHHFLDWSLDAC
jgi:hypothetical protein